MKTMPFYTIESPRHGVGRRCPAILGRAVAAVLRVTHALQHVVGVDIQAEEPAKMAMPPTGR